MKRTEKILRNIKGLSRKQIAKELNITVEKLTNHEQGKEYLGLDKTIELWNLLSSYENKNKKKQHMR